VLGVGGQALISPDKLWLGLGIGGLAMVLSRLADLLLVTADWVRWPSCANSGVVRRQENPT
jgi:hypothetical protein